MHAAPNISADKYPWIEEAACDGMDQEDFFPERYEWPALKTALMTCLECPVILDCRAFFDSVEKGRNTGHVYGVVGGETPVMRIARRKRESGVNEQ